MGMKSVNDKGKKLIRDEYQAKVVSSLTVDLSLNSNARTIINHAKLLK